MAFRPTIALASFLAFSAAPCLGRAIAEVESESGEYSLEAIGNLRMTGAYMRFAEVPELMPARDDGLSSSEIRLLFDGDLGERLDYETNLYLDLVRSPLIDAGGASAFATAGDFASPYRNKHLSLDYAESGALRGQIGVDRLILGFDADPIRISAGRMPINHSVTRIFAPNDFFAPFSAAAINKVYKPGVDALRVSASTGMLSTVEVDGVLGSDRDDGAPSWSRSAVLVRAATVLWGFEWGVIGGKLAERWVAGASLQGEAGIFGLRTEGHVGFPDADADGQLGDYGGYGATGDSWYGRLATGVDVSFSWRNSAVALEYMYLSDGGEDPSDYLDRAGRLFPDDLLFLGRHYAGLSLGGDIAPILRLNAVGLANLEDGSGLSGLTLVHSVSDEADLAAGALVPWGERSGISSESSYDPVVKSEFGTAPLVAFVETRLYF